MPGTVDFLPAAANDRRRTPSAWVTLIEGLEAEGASALASYVAKRWVAGDHFETCRVDLLDAIERRR